MKHIFSFLSVFIVSFLFVLSPVHAADPQKPIRDPGFAVEYVTQSELDPITIEAGTTKDITIQFKNTGKHSWIHNGSNYVSGYTVEPRLRSSLFSGEGWESAEQTDRIRQNVLPGQIGKLVVSLHAPEQTGFYKEEFHLAADGWTWIDGGYFYLDINVVEAAKVPEVVEVSKDTNDDVLSEEAVVHEAKRIGLSKKKVEAVGGEKIKVVAIYQNTGETAWNGYRFSTDSSVGLASASSSASFADHGWQSGNIILAANDAVAPGGLVRETFYFRAPEKKGDYTFAAGLAVDGMSLDQFNINVHVTENAPLNYDAPSFDDTDSGDMIDPEVPVLDEEPRIRVGLSTKEQTTLQFVSYEDDYRVFDGDKEMGILSKRKVGILKYASGMYSFDGSGIYFQTDAIVRLEPVHDPHAVFTLMNISRPIAWAGPGDFNKYRGALEYQIGENDGVLYAVNDLFLEDYVKGISETARGNQLEFVKANLTAARTYAYASLGKYPFFDVLGSTYDQLYLGYNIEVHNPQVAQAADASRGRMVTYEGEVVTTPYFGNSGGYTKAWHTVWGGKSKPWLVPVKATYDLRDNRRQFGHGVGMSQRDANIRAKEEGVDYKELLKYYYTGVEATLMYR